MKWLCPGHIATRTAQYARPCNRCTGYAKGPVEA